MFNRFVRSSKLLLAVTLVAGFASAAAAQTPAPASPAAVAAPASPVVSKPALAAHAPLPAGIKVNLNTATAAELDTLPQVGKSRSQAIMAERAKSPFKDWADFDKRMQHTSVNRGVKAKIKDFATF